VRPAGKLTWNNQLNELEGRAWKEDGMRDSAKREYGKTGAKP